jgi:hypothetical protein
MPYTLTYSDGVKGWQSFYSYYPEQMIGMNNRFYSFSGGNLWVHNSDNVDRNSFYGEPSYLNPSRITGVINEDPSVVKTFKTFYLESNDTWDATFLTDLGSGYIEKGWFSLKEGDYYAHIRRNDSDGVYEMRSTQGIGKPIAVSTAGPTSINITFGFNIDSIMSVGDIMYKKDTVGITLIGTITEVSGSIVNVDQSSGGAIPTTRDFLLYIKNNIVESYGTTGYYMQYTIENNSSNFVEIYAIGSSLFKSHP